MGREAPLIALSGPRVTLDRTTEADFGEKEKKREGMREREREKERARERERVRESGLSLMYLKPVESCVRNLVRAVKEGQMADQL